MPIVTYHYLPVGFKRLVIELDLPDFKLYLVHLALHWATRQKQYKALQEIVQGVEKPCIITGDFNTFKGCGEIHDMCSKLKLINVNESALPTWPAWKPEKQLDFMLCSEQIRVDNFRIPVVRCSDHLPLILDFHI